MLPKSSDLIKFSQGSSKLSDRIFHMSIPCGFTCTSVARSCLTFADRKTGKVRRGPDAEFNCYYAMMEAAYPNVRQNSWHNWDLLKKARSQKRMVNLIEKSLFPLVEDYWSSHHQNPIIRIHVGGEFYCETYFKAWMKVAEHLAPMKFYAYTKQLNFWLFNTVPDNVNLTASEGGKLDYLIYEHNLKYNRVVFSEEEADLKGLPLDKDDWHAHTGTESFASLLHGTQPKGSKAAAAKKALSEKGFIGYGKNQYRSAPPEFFDQLDTWHRRIEDPKVLRILEQAAA